MRPAPRTLWIVGAGLGLALLPALGLPHAWPALLVFWVALLPVLLADGLACPRRSRLRWELETPDALHVGVSRELPLTVHLGGDWQGRVSAFLDTEEPLPPLPLLRASGRHGEARLAWRLQAPRRGTTRLGALWLMLESPLGLWRRAVREPIDRELAILPDVPRIKAEALRFEADREFRLGLKTERYQGEGSEFDSLKEFVRGDDRRTIDWKASARHRRLLARQSRAERNHRVLLSVDTGRLMAEPLAATTRLDHALQSALLLAHACLRTGDHVGLFTFDAQARMLHAPSGGLTTLHHLIAGASRAFASEDETNFTLALTRLGQQLSRRSLVVLFTEFADTVSAELMLENVGRLVRRHVLLFVSIRDPRLDALLRQPPDSLETLSAVAVTQRLLRDRERVHRDLGRLGVHVLDARPEQLTPGLIREYLDIRRRERI